MASLHLQEAGCGETAAEKRLPSREGCTHGPAIRQTVNTLAAVP